jgi:hypothetical protein
MIYHICTKTMPVKGDVYDHEAYEANKIKNIFAMCIHHTGIVFVHIYTTYVSNTPAPSSGSSTRARAAGGVDSCKDARHTATALCV